jgi:hypothetical protein
VLRDGGRGHRSARSPRGAWRPVRGAPGPRGHRLAAVAARDVTAREREADEAHAWVVAQRGLEKPARELANIYDELVSPSA